MIPVVGAVNAGSNPVRGSANFKFFVLLTFMNPIELHIPETSLSVKSYTMNNGDKLYLPICREDNVLYIIAPNGPKLVNIICFSESMFNEQRIRRIYEYGFYSNEEALEMINRYKKFGNIEIVETKFEYEEIVYESNIEVV